MNNEERIEELKERIEKVDTKVKNLKDFLISITIGAIIGFIIFI